MFSFKFAAYFKNTFSQEHLWVAAFRNESLTLIYFITKMHYTQFKARFIVESSVHKNNQFNKREPNFFRKKID